MPWPSVSDFLAMGGYAVYVWGSIGACALAMTLEPWLLRCRRARLLDELRRLRAASAPLRPAVPVSVTARPRQVV